MKTGVILYVSGRANLNDESEMQDAVKRLGIKADRIETIFSGSSHFDVMDAWWSLTAKGMKQIVSMIAEFVNGSGLRPSVWNIEAGYNYDWGRNLEIVLKYAGSDDTEDLGFPRSRYGIGFNQLPLT